MPFIVAWGDRIERPHVNGHVGYFPDVMPTLCDIAGVETPPTDGISLWPTIRGKERRQQEHDYLYWEFPGGKGWVAVRWGDWKGLLRKVKEGNTQLELYDVRHDLLEEHDVGPTTPTWWPGCGSSSAPRIPSRKTRFSKWRSPKSDRQVDRMRRLRLRREGPDGRIAPPKGGATNRR